MQAKATLKKLGQGQIEEVLVQEYLNGIRNDVVQLIGAKSIVRQAGSCYESNFAETVNYFHSTWQSCHGEKRFNKKRNASSAARQQPDGGGNTSDKRRRYNDQNFKPENKSYPRDEWFALTKGQQDAVRSLRTEAKQQRDAQRVVAAALSNNPDRANSSGNHLPPPDQAGNQFGRKAHQQ